MLRPLALPFSAEELKRLDELYAQIADDLSIPEFMKRVKPAIETDMYRVERSDGTLSDIINLTRAREAARIEHRRNQAQSVKEKEKESGDSSSNERARGDDGDAPRKVPPSSSPARSGRTQSPETDRQPRRPRLRKHRSRPGKDHHGDLRWRPRNETPARKDRRRKVGVSALGIKHRKSRSVRRSKGRRPTK